MILLSAILACSGPSDLSVRRAGEPEGEGSEPLATATPDPAGSTPLLTGLSDWIGSPCSSDADCPYDGAVCLPSEDGFPGGMCTQACDGLCPDAEGFPETFCSSAADLPGAAATLGVGSCDSRCDFSIYPETGCREGYGCAASTRPDGSGDQAWACLPDRADELPSCYHDLADRGIGFEPIFWADEHPAEAPDLTCHVEDPLWLIPPVLGVDLRASGDDAPSRVLFGCVAAGAFADSADDLFPLGVDEVEHFGTYNCRTIAGSTSLSEHGAANAIDMAVFWFSDGSSASVYDDWEDGVDNPTSVEGQFLYDTAHRWYDNWLWNVILTPEYNADHDDHFHVDMTDGSHFLGRTAPPHRLEPNPSGE